MIRRPPRSTLDRSSAASDVYKRQERYSVLFSDDGQQITYTPDNADEFAQFAPGSRWSLTVNGFGDITDLQPAP